MKEHKPAVHLLGSAYRNSGEHLRDELARVDLLIRAQTLRWRMTIGAHKPENLWGMVHVTEAEIEHYLDTDIGPPDYLPDEVFEILRPFHTAEDEAAERIARAEERTAPDVDLRVNRLAQAFGLGVVERDIALLCLLPELDIRYRRIYGYLQDDASRSHPTIELIAQIVLHKIGSLEGARALLSPAGPLFRNRILVSSGQEEGHSSRFVRLDDRIAAFLLASDEPDARCRGMVRLLPPGRWESLLLPADLLTELRDFASHIKDQPAVVFYGPYGSGKESAARAIATQHDRLLLAFDVEAALREPAKWEETVELAFREARLLGAAIYADGIDHLQEDERPAHLGQYLLRAAHAFPGIAFLAGSAHPDPSRRFQDSGLVRFEFPVPPFDLRRRIWMVALQFESLIESSEAMAPRLAAAFQITEGQVRDAVAAARAAARLRSFSNPQITADDLQAACRKQAGRRLLGFARRIEPTRQLTLDDVILSEPNKTQVRELLHRVRLRSRVEREMHFERKIALGKGLVVLLAGAPGTGKTLCAELIANQQGIDLYKVDASAVVSKWVGQTEKNLSRVFAEAEDSDALLFFDECDSLFGQRGETGSEASGRWANLQVNYLLTRIEEYSGVVVLATNLRKNIDEAFIRRIQVIIDFPTPDAAMRFQIWKRTLPAASTAITDVELQDIASRFALTGGNMRNASIDAAFRALAAGREKIGIRDLVDAIAREYQKVAKPITQGEFGVEFYGWALADILAPAPAG